MVIKTDAGVPEEDILLRGGSSGGYVREGNAFPIIQIGYGRITSGHTKIKIDVLILIFRPGIRGVTVLKTPSVIASFIHIFVHPNESSFTEIAGGIDIHCRIQFSDIKRISRGALGGRGRVQVFDGLRQEERFTTGLTQRNHVTFHGHRKRFH